MFDLGTGASECERLSDGTATAELTVVALMLCAVSQPSFVASTTNPDCV